MLPNDIGYDIYYSGGCHERPLPRRQSWPKGHQPSDLPTKGGARLSPRRILGRALIALGQAIAAERPQTVKRGLAGHVR